MEPNKQGAADDLDAGLQGMLPVDPTSTRQLPPFPAPTSLLLPSPPLATPQGLVRPPPLSPLPPQPTSQGLVQPLPPFAFPPPSPSSPRMLVPTATPDMRLLLPQQLQVAPQYWPQRHLQGYGVGGSTQGAGNVSPVVGSCFPGSVYASQFGVYSPRFNAPAAPAVLEAPKSRKLSASASDYRPSSCSHRSAAPSSTTLSASAKPYRPTAPSRPLMALSSSTPSSIASQGQTSASNHQPGGAVSFSARHDDGSLDPYPSALPSPLRANQAADSRFWSAPGAPRLPTTLQETSEHVVRVLEKGAEWSRLMVLAGVKRDVHRVMRSREGHVVFLALLRACEGRFGELKGIADAAASSDSEGLLMNVTEQSHGETALKELIRVVAPYPQLCMPLVDCLLHDRLMEQSNGVLLLHHFFTTLPYEYSTIIIRFAITNFDDMLSSADGLKCLGECFVNARNGELNAVEEMTFSRTCLIAKTDYSFYFLQRVFECGSKRLKEHFVERVVEDLMSLSMHRNGRFVVEACFLKMGSLALLQRMLTVFLGLGDDRLSKLVQDRCGCYVVQKLLKAGEDHFPEQAMELARQIEKLPAAVVGNMLAWRWALLL